MQAIQIQVVPSRSFCSGDGFQVYGDGGTGHIDWSYALTSRRRLFWPDASAAAGHLLGGHAMGPHLDGIRPDGHVQGMHLLDEHLFPAASIIYETDPLVFGRFRHAVVTEDAAGNATTTGVTVHETVINSAPPPAFDFRPAAWDQGDGRLTFSFSPSDRLTS